MVSSPRRGEENVEIFSDTESSSDGNDETIIEVNRIIEDGVVSGDDERYFSSSQDSTPPQSPEPNTKSFSAEELKVKLIKLKEEKKWIKRQTTKGKKIRRRVKRERVTVYSAKEDKSKTVPTFTCKVSSTKPQRGKDKNSSKVTALADTGASSSCMPESIAKQLGMSISKNDKIRVTAANGKHIAISGVAWLYVKIEPCNYWTFIWVIVTKGGEISS